MFPRGRNILERKPVGGAHFNWLHVLEGPHRGRGPREPPSISTLPRGTLGPMLSIWPAAPVRSPSQQDQRCGGRAEALIRVVHASVKSGGGDSGAGTRGGGLGPPDPAFSSSRKEHAFCFRLQYLEQHPRPPGNEGPCPLVLSPGWRRRRPRLGTPALRPPARPLSRPRESWASGQAAGAPWGHRTGLIM